MIVSCLKNATRPSSILLQGSTYRKTLSNRKKHSKQADKSKLGSNHPIPKKHSIGPSYGATRDRKKKKKSTRLFIHENRPHPTPPNVVCYKPETPRTMGKGDGRRTSGGGASVCTNGQSPQHPLDNEYFLYVHPPPPHYYCLQLLPCILFFS